MTVDFEIYLYPRAGTDYDQKLLGVSLLERCAAIVSETFNKNRVYAPFLENSKVFAGISISTDFPDFSKDILLLDPAFLCNETLLTNIVNNFDHTVLASDASSLLPLGLAYVNANDVDDEFHKAPWFKVDRIIEENNGKRVAVIDGKYFYVKNNSSAKDASEFILHNLRLKSDGPLTANVYRPISLMFTKLFSFSNISPDVWSILSIVFSVFSSICFSSTGYFRTVFAAVILQIAFLFCNIDGESARLKYIKSDYGLWLNGAANTSVILFPSLGIVVSLQDGFLLRMELLFIGFFIFNSIVSYYYAYINNRFAAESVFMEKFITGSRKGYYRIFLKTVASLARKDGYVFFIFALSMIGLARIFIPFFAAAMVIATVFSFIYYIGGTENRGV